MGGFQSGSLTAIFEQQRRRGRNTPDNGFHAMTTLRPAALALVLLAGLALPGTGQAQDPATAPDTIVFTTSRGVVTYTHGAHAKLAECVSCHHESRAEKPLESQYQKCSACHTEPATEPVKTTLRAAYHDTVRREGMCYTCHKEEAARGKQLPMQCAECHRRQPQPQPQARR
jgi:hypothetical protein